jgi:hypothetical protein
MSRRSKQQTRQVLIDAGMAHLDREGLQVGTQHVRLPGIAVETAISAGAAYYAFPDGQEEYQQALWSELARRSTQAASASASAIGPIEDALAEAPIDEFIRVVCTDHASFGSDESWRVRLAIASAGDNVRADEARSIVADDLARRDARLVPAVEALLDRFDRAIRPPHTVADLVVAIGTLQDGARFRTHYQGAVADRVVLRRNDVDDLQRWSLFACTVQSIVSTMTLPRRAVDETPTSALIDQAAKVSLIASSVERDLTAMEGRMRDMRVRLQRTHERE